MRKIFTIFVALLMISSIIPYETYAENSKNETTDVSQVKKEEVDKQDTENRELQQEFDESDEEKTPEKELSKSKENKKSSDSNETKMDNADNRKQDVEQDATKEDELNKEETDKQKAEVGESDKEKSEQPETEQEKIEAQNEPKVMMRSMAIEKSNTSKLGHIRNSKVKIYPDLNDLSKSITAGSKYTHHVYYIKREAVLDGQTYYLIRSKIPNKLHGTFGWVNASDMNEYAHTVVDKRNKTFYIKGSGSAYNDAWGGRNNLAYRDLSNFAGQTFKVHLTEKVGKQVWYRGTLGGKTVWIHPDHLKTNYVEKPTSKLGHIRSSKVKIYPDLNDLSNSITAGSKYTHHVYYIKREADIDGQIYYLIRSKKPNKLHGTFGWVKASDMNEYAHTVVDKKDKTFYIKGSGSAYNDAWGGRNNLAYRDLSNFAGQTFKVHLTEKVGKQVWYRGTLGGKTVWIHPDHLKTNYVEKKTSKLGHIRSSKVKIYPDLNDLSNSITAGSKYTHHVYYIKRQAEIDGQTYYLIRSKKPNKLHGTFGWVKASDMNEYAHTVVDKKDKTFYIKGSGSAYKDAWGGRNNLAYADLSNFSGQAFKVHLTEKVGEQVWYRGTLGGKTVWVHPSYLTNYVEKKTSKLGHINSSKVKIYPDLNDLSKTITAGSKYTHHVYYIKREAVLNGQTYYLIRSKKPNKLHGTFGWVKASDMKEYAHIVVDKKDKTFYINGSGSAYNDAWGGRNNLAYADLSNFSGQAFKVHLTEKVGEQVWYRGTLGGKTVWIHPEYLSQSKTTNYNFTLNEAMKAQMKVQPQTDKKYAYVSKTYIDKNNKVTASALNVRSGPGTNYNPLGQLSNGAQVEILDEFNGWYAIYYYQDKQQWVHASPKDVLYYLDPDNFLNDIKQQFQFVDLSRNSSAKATSINKILKNDGVLKNKGSKFIEAGNKYKVNDIYLVSHAKLETGNGDSELASGISRWVKRDKNGNVVTDKNDKPIIIDISPKKVYNVYGVGAFDKCARDCGAQHAYNEGWYSVDTAIIEGAQFIGEKYVNAGQNTLHKMRWNYVLKQGNYVPSHQYATDVGWASKQVYTMYNLYQELDSYTLYFDVPVYK